jgi:DNA adenine methylase
MQNVYATCSRPVRPVSPAAPYIGGKKQLARRLAAMIAAVPHETYVEPFVGMGGVFLRRTRAPKCEVINDISGDVATFFRILQRHYQPFMDLLRWRLTGRAEFERLLATDPATLTDLERAARFLYLQRTAFGGKVAGRSFGVAVGRPGRFDVARLATVLDELHDRLSGVIIERLPYAELIDRYDSPGTLFYLDPPYWGSEDDYGAGVFGRDDFSALATQLAGIAGRFILSVNDVPDTRQAFAGFEIEGVELTYTIVAGKASPAKEIIVSSKGLPRQVESMSLFD